MFIRLVLALGGLAFCIFIFVWLKNSKFLDCFIKDAIIEPEYSEPEVDKVIEDIRAGKNTLKQKASDNKKLAKQAEKEAAKIDGYLKK